jgi:hypothetical protein
MRGAQNFYRFGVLEYVETIEFCGNEVDEEFLRRHQLSGSHSSGVSVLT